MKIKSNGRLRRDRLKAIKKRESLAKSRGIELDPVWRGKLGKSPLFSTDNPYAKHAKTGVKKGARCNSYDTLKPADRRRIDAICYEATA